MRGTGTHRDRCLCSKLRREKGLERLEGGLVALYEWSGVGWLGCAEMFWCLGVRAPRFRVVVEYSGVL